VVCIKTYDGFPECIRYINSRPRPLGLYYFGEDAKEERIVLDRTTSGGVTINDVLSHASCDDLPFGGIGHSGMGNYHGHDGFRTFSHQKAVFRQTRIDVMELGGMLPPYGEKCEKQLDKLTRV
jgi:coniferyl-aldehyde dehydrogenase